MEDLQGVTHNHLGLRQPRIVTISLTEDVDHEFGPAEALQNQRWESVLETQGEEAGVGLD